MAGEPLTAERIDELAETIHLLACPRWDEGPAETCPYQPIHIEWAEKRGPAFLAAPSDAPTGKDDWWADPNLAARMRGGLDHGDFFMGSGLCKTCRQPWPCPESRTAPSDAPEKP